MLTELHVRDLGVISDLTVTLAGGMTAITGETGAGKTLIVGAIELLLGVRADAGLVREGAEEARVEGRFERDGGEVILARVVPRQGRSRAYVDGRLATASELAELGAELVDLHGQHGHQSLLATAVQRRALDRFGDVDLSGLASARAVVAEIDEGLAQLGGDARSRAREIDLLGFQVGELEGAGISDAEEEDKLDAEEDLLADAVTHTDAGARAYEELTGENGAAEVLGRAVSAVAGRRPFLEIEGRLRAAAADMAEAAADLRARTEGIVVDPARLDAVRARRQLLSDLKRKYGESLSEVLAYGEEAAERLAELERHDDRVRELESARSVAVEGVARCAAEVAEARQNAAPGLARAVEAHLQALALPGARFEVTVDGEAPGDAVTFRLSANPGEPARPVASAASGGELARTMLALRLVLTAGPPCLVFDEVDAGIGGEAALAVGRSLAALTGAPQRGGGAGHQVLVVTHLPQVAAFADHQVVVTKSELDGRTVAVARTAARSDRVVELSRMLSGQPSSTAARGHAEELLQVASREREA